MTNSSHPSRFAEAAQDLRGLDVFAAQRLRGNSRLRRRNERLLSSRPVPVAAGIPIASMYRVAAGAASAPHVESRP